MSDTQPATSQITYRGQCHCGAVRFTARATARLTITLCNCSICFMSGQQEVMVPREAFALEQGEAFLTTYRFGTGKAAHTFCRVCGIKPFYTPRSHAGTHVSVNARALDLSAAEAVTYVDFDGQHWEEAIAAGSHRVTAQD